MNIFIVKKKHLISILLILILSALFALLYILHFTPLSFAFELSKNSNLDNSIKEKISSLTKNNEKIAYLTFDDGPTLHATSRILDILKEENVKATFFVIGKYVKNHPDLTKREYEEGHYIANHGYNHNNSKLYASEESFIKEIQDTDKEIGNAIGVQDYCSHIFRFPNGFISPNYKTKKKKAVELLSSINYTYVDWNCLNNDSIRKYSKQQLLNNLKKSSKNKGTLIILMHDTTDVNDTASILEESISYLKSEGYEFHNFYDFI